MGSPVVKDKIIAALERHKNETVTVTLLMQEADASKTAVQSVINTLQKSGKVGIDILSHGNVWIYRGAVNGNSGDKPLYEEIGRASDGRIVLQDLDGKLYVAKEL